MTNIPFPMHEEYELPDIPKKLPAPPLEAPPPSHPALLTWLLDVAHLLSRLLMLGSVACALLTLAAAVVHFSGSGHPLGGLLLPAGLAALSVAFFLGAFWLGQLE